MSPCTKSSTFFAQIAVRAGGQELFTGTLDATSLIERMHRRYLDVIRTELNRMKIRDIVDGIIPEPAGGAHHDYDLAARRLDEALWPALQTVMALPEAERLDIVEEPIVMVGLLGASVAAAGEWPGWRGPRGDGSPPRRGCHRPDSRP